MKKVFVLYYDDENGGTYTMGILTKFKIAEKIIKDNFKVFKEFCDSNMVTYETEIGLLTIQEWDLNSVNQKAIEFYKEQLKVCKAIKGEYDENKK